MTRTLGSRLAGGLGGGLLGVWLLFAIVPFVWMIFMSLHDQVDAFSAPPHIFAPPTLENFTQVWVNDRFWTHALSTAIVTGSTVLVSLSIGLLAGYGLSRYRGSLGFVLLLMALAFRAMPPVVLLTAVKPIFYEYGLWNRYDMLVLVLVAFNQPATIYMLRSFFVAIPVDLDEAAMMDGCTRFGAFRRVILPLMGPGLVTTGLFSFLLAYNDFLLASQLMNSDQMPMTAALGSYLNAARDMQAQMYAIAGAVSITAPLLLLVAVFQRRIVAGLVQGAVKG